MIHRICKILFAALFFTASGCSDDTEKELPWDNSPDGKVRLELKLQAARIESQSSKAGNSGQAIGNDVYVLVFDGSNAGSKLKSKPSRATEINGDKIYAVLEEQDTPSFLYVLSANLDNTVKEYLQNSAPAGTSYEEIQQHITLAEATENGLGAPLPMGGWSVEIAKIKKGSFYAATIQMIRAVAAIDIEISDIITSDNFTLTGVILANAARSGWLLPPAEIKAQNGATAIQYKAAVPGAGENKISGQVFCYENNGQSGQFTHNPTRIVIKGKYNNSPVETFYGINIAYAPDPAKPDDLSYNIDRNKIYGIRINKVEKSGYNTLEEAIKNPEFNMAIEADITVTDPYAHDIITNGKQYLGMTNSDFLVHPNTNNATVTGAAITTISYTTESSWSIGQITLPAGLSFSNGNNSRLELGNGSSPVVREIIVDIAPGFTEGDIVVSIGNLTKNIHVRRMSAISALGGICEDYATDDYTVGEVINPSGNTAWVKLSDQKYPEGESSLQDQITSPNGKIYVHFSGNVSFENSAFPREAQLYISGGQGKSRSRILVQQNAYEIYKDKNNVQIENSYVGTFHRWNQSAERVIRMDASKYQTDRDVWTATVVTGGDFIVLSTDPPKDTNIDPNDPFGDKTTSGPQYKSDEEIEANCQVDGNEKTVSGTGRKIYFKVGLKNRLSAPESQPRYGLIAVIHGGGNHLIYVRQGEAADYLMRPWDDWKEGEGSQSGRTRNEAFKISPYNLTDPQKSTDHEIDRGKRGYVFTEYPSQGGYYFMGITTKAYPRQSTGTTSNTSFTPWSDVYETCPVGYRHMKDNENGLIGGSEIRLSLWLYPRPGSAQNSITNQYRGYIADGYFDRRNIETIDPKNDLTYRCRVNGSDPTASAYQGTLFFNPRNMASVFIPEAGSYSSFVLMNQGVTDEGFWGGIHTSTPMTNYNNYWLLNTGINRVVGNAVTSDMYTGMHSFGWSVRCVKDESSPILNDGENEINPFPSGPGTEINLISLDYKAGGTSLQSQLENTNPEGLSNTGTLNIFGAALTDADYQYLNDLADHPGNKLQHLILSGTANKRIPTGAFTSAKWVSVTFRDADVIAAGAFNIRSGSTYHLKNIKFGCYDAIQAAPDAFVFPADFDYAEAVNLFLAGSEYSKAKNGKTWANISWYSIKNYYGNK